LGTGPRNAAIPSALQPRPLPPPLPTLHLAFVVPDERIQKLLRDHCYVIGPTRTRMAVTVHAVLADKEHAAVSLGEFMRWALVESGLLPPEEVGLVTKAQLELGWPTHHQDTEE
jgi:hypothetical protein